MLEYNRRPETLSQAATDVIAGGAKVGAVLVSWLLGCSWHSSPGSFLIYDACEPLPGCDRGMEMALLKAAEY